MEETPVNKFTSKHGYTKMVVSALKKIKQNKGMEQSEGQVL